MAQSNTQIDTAKVVAAQFPKGEKGWKKYILRKLDDFTAEPNYPKGDFSLNVIVSFKVDVNGDVVEVRIHKSCGNKKIDSYALDLIEGSPKWLPATVNGEKTKFKILQSITFNGREF